MPRIIYPLGVSNQIFNVNAGEEASYILSAPTLTWDDLTTATYTITGNDGMEVSKFQWLENGGWISYETLPATHEIKINLKGARNLGTNFSLCTVKKDGSRENSFYIWAVESEQPKILRKSDSKSRVVVDAPNRQYVLEYLDGGKILLTPEV